MRIAKSVCSLAVSSLSILLTSLTALAQYEVYWENEANFTYDVASNTLDYNTVASYANALSSTEFTGQKHILFTDVPTGVDLEIGWVIDGAGINHLSFNANFNEIDYGFYFTSSNVEIREAGVQKSTHGSYSSTDTFKIERTSTHIDYSINSTVVYQTSIGSSPALVAEALCQTNSVEVPVIYTDAYTPISISTSTSEHDHEQLGSIEMDIRGGQRPYKVEFPKAEIVDQTTYDDFMEDYYDQLKLTANADIAAEFDLTSFPSYDDFLTMVMRWEIEDIPAGRYDLVVTDALDSIDTIEVIVPNKVYWNTVVGDYSYSAGTAIIERSCSPCTTLAESPGKNTMNRLYPNRACGIEFTAPTRSGDFAAGLINASAATTTYSSTTIEAGFEYTSGAGLKLIENGVTVNPSSAVTMTTSTRLRLEVTPTVYEYYVDDVLVGTYTPMDIMVDEKKFVAFIEKDEDEIQIDKTWDFTYVPQFAITPDRGVCGMISGSVLNSYAADEYYEHAISYQWTDASGSTAYPSQPTLDNVEPGWYTLTATVTLSAGNQPLTIVLGTYFIGHKVNWIQEVNAINNPGSNSLELSSSSFSSALNVGEANSTNQYIEAEEDEFGWIYTELPPTAAWPYSVDEASQTSNYITSNQSIILGASLSKYGYKALPLGNGTYPATEYGVTIAAAYFPSANGQSGHDYILKLIDPPGGYLGNTVFTAAAGDRIVQVVDEDHYKLYINDMSTPVADVDYGANFGDMNIKGEIEINYGNTYTGSNYVYHDLIYDCIASFKCPDQPYNRLSHQLRGEYYNTMNGNFYFMVDGQYNSGELDYDLQDMLGNDVSSSANISNTYKGYGDNRYVLDLNDLSNGFYVLRVTNEKNEVYSIRINKDL